MALYIPTNFSPHYKTYDMDENQTFSATINGSQVTDYQVVIKKVSDDTQVYDSTKINLTTSLYDKETLEHSISGLTVSNGYEYKWILTVWDGTTTVSSTELFFTAYTTPTLSLSVSSPIITQSYEFVPTYSQTESIPAKKFNAILYNSSGTELDNSGWIYSANVRYTFEGFISGDSYNVIFYIEDQNGLTANTGEQSFSALYDEPSIEIVPTTTLNEDYGSIDIYWDTIVQYVGALDETATYIENFIDFGDYALEISDGKTLEYGFSLPSEFSLQYRIKFGTSYTSGVFLNIGDLYELGYDGTKFYGIYDSVTYDGTANTIPSDIFLVIITPERFYIKTDSFTDTILIT